MMTDRHTKLLEIMSVRRRAEVSVLADLLRVSQVTIRKDLDTLEERGLIRREHGFACLNNSDDTGNRITFNYDIKRRIAKAAAQTVEDGETIMIASGSCCALLAEELSNAEKDITIITNSVFIANFIKNISRTKIILLGGLYQPEAQVVVGHLTRECGEIFFSDKFFFGTDGFIPDFGFTGKDLMRTQAVKDLSEYAREKIVLTEAEKFQRRGPLGLIKLDKVSAVYTDDRIPEKTEKLLLEKNITVYKVPERTE